MIVGKTLVIEFTEVVEYNGSSVSLIKYNQIEYALDGDIKSIDGIPVSIVADKIKG